MAVVGEAHVIVRAITTQVSRDIQRGFSGASSQGRRAGESMGAAFSRGFNRNVNANTFSRLSQAIQTMVPGAESARRAFQNLLGMGYTLQTALVAIVPAVFSVIGSIGSLAGAAAGAMPVLAGLGNVLIGLGSAMSVARLALGGIGQAVSQATRAAAGGGGGGGGGGGSAPNAGAQIAAQRAREAAVRAVENAERSLGRTIAQNRDALLQANRDVAQAQQDLNRAMQEGREQIQQLGFDAEDAALNEQRAALELEKAREALARAQDLPPNSRARREAELAYQEAELNYRKAKDSAADLAAEQDRLAREGLAGTDAVAGATADLAKAEADREQAVKDAAESEADGLRDVADARRRLAEETADLARAGQAAAAAAVAGGGGVDPFAGLNDAQRRFAQFLIGLKPLMDELKQIASDNFLPPLQTAIQTLVDRGFPTLRQGVDEISTSMGRAVITLANMITTGDNLENLGLLFSSSARLIELMSVSAGHLYGILLSIFVGVSPQVERFFNFLNERLATFDAYLTRVGDNGELEAFFARSGDILANFGTIFSNIFSAINQIILANFGEGSPGDQMVQLIIDLTGYWAAFLENANRTGELAGYFEAVNANAGSVFAVLGDIIKALFDLAANPAIGQTFDRLRDAGPGLKTVADAAIAAAPSLANLVVSIVDMAAAFVDTQAMEIFFGTLQTIADTITRVLESDVGQAIFTVTARVAAFAAAFGVLAQLANFGLKVISGGFIGLSSTFGGVISGINTVRGAVALSQSTFSGAAREALTFQTRMAILASTSTGAQAGLFRTAGVFAGMGTAASTAASKIGTMAASLGRVLLGPVGIVIGVIALLVGAIVALYNTNDEFRQQIDTAIAPIMMTFQKLLHDLMIAVQPLIQVFGELVAAVLPPLASILSTVVAAIAPLVASLVSALVPVLTSLIPIILPIVDLLLMILVPAIQAVAAVFEWLAPIITTVLEVVVGILTAVIGTIVALITDFDGTWSKIWSGISGFFEGIWNGIQAFIRTAAALLASIIITVVTGIKTNWDNLWNGIKSFFEGIWNGIQFAIGVYMAAVRLVIATVLTVISSTWNNAWNGIKDFFGGIWNGITGIVNSIGDTFRRAFENIPNIVRGAFETVLSVIRNPINGIIGLVNGVISSLNQVKIEIPDWVPGVGGQTYGVNIPKIPSLAKGGIAMPTTSGQLVHVAEAGRPERIEPLDSSGLSQRDRAMIQLLSGEQYSGPMIQITVNALPGQSVEELAAEIDRRLSAKIRKGAFTS